MSEIDPSVLEAAREFLLDRRPRGGLAYEPAFVRYGLDDPAVAAPLIDLAIAVGAGSARQCLVNWNAWLPEHRDKTAPYPCTNVMVVLRSAGSAGGELWFREGDDVTGYPCADGDVVRFDGQTPHYVEQITRVADDDYRVSVLFYVPLDGAT